MSGFEEASKCKSDGEGHIEWRAKVNPYFRRIQEFPDRIFLELDAQQEIIRSQLQTSEIFVEFGSGSGGHLIERARRTPTAAFFGIELRYKRAVRTIEKAQNIAVNNLSVLRANAKDCAKMFPASSVSGAWINFPDPWPKRRGSKHRLMQEEFFRDLSIILKPGAFLSIKTDHREYFHSVIALLNDASQFALKERSEDLRESEYAADSVETEFERMFVRQGLPIYYVRFEHRLLCLS